ncbi:hypothetical protein QWJ90_04140 [Microbacterium oryzae]|uniref:hypothetical protein n=1 Tax=Microbacterium oryzae TaxID=743009 RepID=UPI0025B08894|nr:hypothetical protein [Microbacterium oryzae]MDN3310115.1 hypothetical protein [Microbacterium oryzae]
MYFSDLMRGLLRRWYVIVAGLALAGWGASYVYGETPVRYEAGSTLMLLPPQESIDAYEGDNPYLILGGLGQALAVLNTRLNSQEQHELLVPDDDADYGVGGDTSSGAAFLAITTQAGTEEDALALVGQVEAAAETQLALMQQELDVEDISTIGMMRITSDIEATELSSERTQLTLAVAAVGVVLSVVLAGAVEGLATARSRRKAALEVQPARERDPLEPLRARDVPHQDTVRPRDRRRDSAKRRRSSAERTGARATDVGAGAAALEGDEADVDVIDGEVLTSEHRR